MADDNRREDIAAAFEAAEKAPEPTPEPIQQDLAIATPPEPIGEKPRDDKGRFAPKIGEEPKPEVKPKAEAKPAEVPKAEDKPPVEAKPAEPAKPVEPERPKVRAPASWKPTAREGWDKVPPDIQQEVIRREREITHTLSETAEARQNYSKFKETIAPFEHMIRSEGVEPVQAVGNLLRTAASLATGPQQTKAQIVAGLIKTYGVDIATLDSLLSGQAPAQQPQGYQAPPNPAQFRDPRLDALLEQQTQRVQQQAAEALADVEQEEFFDDVRQDMADLLEVASKRGVALSARDAYTRAVALHPEVSRVLEQRKAAGVSNGAAQRAAAAASSVRAQPTATVASAGGSLREDLVAAMERLNGRR